MTVSKLLWGLGQRSSCTFFPSHVLKVQHLVICATPQWIVVWALWANSSKPHANTKGCEVLFWPRTDRNTSSVWLHKHFAWHAATMCLPPNDSLACSHEIPPKVSVPFGISEGTGLSRRLETPTQPIPRPIQHFGWLGHTLKRRVWSVELSWYWEHD